MVKRGLIVTYYFPPSGGGGVQRWVKFIKYLSRWNWRFTVITANLSKSGKDESLLNELPQSLNIIRIEHAEPPQKLREQNEETPYWKRWLSALYYISDSRKGWNLPAITAVQNALEKDEYEVILITSPPYSLAMLAAQILKVTNIPIVLDSRDPWTEHPLRIFPTPWHLQANKKMEREAIQPLMFFTTACNSIVDEFAGIAPEISDKKIKVIPNGYDEEDYIDLEPAGLQGKVGYNIGFSGTFYSHLNNPLPFLIAIKALSEEGIRVNFHHIGKSAIDLSKVARKMNIPDQFISWGYLPHRKCLQVLAGMDAYCQILDGKVKHANKVIGGKMYEYLRLRKPILAIVPGAGEVAELIRETDSGIIVSQYEPHGIAQAIKSMIDKKRKFTFRNIEQFNREGQALVLKTYLEHEVIKPDTF